MGKMSIYLNGYVLRLTFNIYMGVCKLNNYEDEEREIGNEKSICEKV